MASNKIYTSPRGRAVYPRITTPDTKFDAAGSYSLKLALKDGEAATEKLRDFLQGMYDELVAKLTEEKNGRKPKMNDVPFEPELDKDGNETGYTLFKFGAKASGVAKKTGKPWERKIPVFDAKGKPMTADVWGGSEVKVSFKPAGYEVASGSGVKCYLEAVQVIELVNGSQKDAGAFGFGEEDGYVDSGETPSEFEGEGTADDSDGADF